MATEADILEAMKQVEDPELGVNVVDLGLVYGVENEDEGRRARAEVVELLFRDVDVEGPDLGCALEVALRLSRVSCSPSAACVRSCWANSRSPR